MSSKTDKTWVETIHEIHTGDSFFYQVGPDPDGLSLELRYLEFDPATQKSSVKARVGFSAEDAIVIGEMIIRAAQDKARNEGGHERR